MGEAVMKLVDVVSALASVVLVTAKSSGLRSNLCHWCLKVLFCEEKKIPKNPIHLENVGQNLAAGFPQTWNCREIL